jgi:hypothetical protein
MHFGFALRFDANNFADCASFVLAFTIFAPLFVYAFILARFFLKCKPFSIIGHFYCIYCNKLPLYARLFMLFVLFNLPL